MAEQGKIVTLTVGATGIRGRLTSNTLNLCSSYNKPSYVFHTGRESFTSCSGQRSTTGYSANLRPAIYYRPGLDHTDNPQLGSLLLDSFTSQTKWHYQPYMRSDCSEAFPNLSENRRESGYLQLRTRPKTNMSLQTEYEEFFGAHDPISTVSQNHVTVGQSRESGFTQETACEPNTFVPKNSCLGKPHRAQDSVMRSDFLPRSCPQGTEALPSLGTRIARETGFTRDTRAPLACPASLLPVSQIKNKTPTEKFIGRKECSGFLLNDPNTQKFPHTPLDPSHFVTNYQSKFCDHAAVENLRCSVNNKRSTGFTRRDMDRFNFRG